MLWGKVAVCGVVLFCLLWSEGAEAGSSFLSPADMQKNAGKKPSKKLLYNNMNRREVGEDPWESLADELSEDQREIGFKIPLDINLKMTREQFEEQRAAIQDAVIGFLSLGSSQGKTMIHWRTECVCVRLFIIPPGLLQRIQPR
ncbi:appetite-regulating hormone isoform X1 [Mixophyes fleayi]|uniref:appetite-regulating hormone isoform X1 n=1 Tax=Mixophyes fleayi TaxID=3061075 RepID=UPI003F4E3FA3